MAKWEWGKTPLFSSFHTMGKFELPHAPDIIVVDYKYFYFFSKLLAKPGKYSPTPRSSVFMLIGLT